MSGKKQLKALLQQLFQLKQTTSNIPSTEIDKVIRNHINGLEITGNGNQVTLQQNIASPLSLAMTTQDTQVQIERWQHQLAQKVNAMSFRNVHEITSRS